MLTDDSELLYGVKYYGYPLKKVPMWYLKLIRKDMPHTIVNIPLMEYIDKLCAKK